MTNEQLAARIRAGENVGNNMAVLYDQVKDFIHAMAYKYHGQGELEDLEQEGFLALYDAIDHYEADQGVKFLTYASHWIRQRMQKYIQNTGSPLRLSAGRQEAIRKYRKFCTEFQAEQGCKPTEAELCRSLWLTLEQLREIQYDACMTAVKSLDAPIKGAEGEEDTTLGELAASAADPCEELLDRLEQEELCSILWQCVDSLPGKQPDVIRSRYKDNLTMKQCGQFCGISEAEVRKQQLKALRSLRSGENAKKLRPFLPEDAWIYSSALIGNGVERFNHTWTSSTERVALEL
ncbi:MAG: sigma-70 family RNA polymerase sigma factor [Lachnospiraceae bacterium]|nr:MAG: sigma-70 family RNA polymerase sigma factor [Lachnospiraceae bacterium]